MKTSIPMCFNNSEDPAMYNYTLEQGLKKKNLLSDCPGQVKFLAKQTSFHILFPTRYTHNKLDFR